MSGNDGLKTLRPTISAESLQPDEKKELEQMETALRDLQSEQAANRKKLQEVRRESRLQNPTEIAQLLNFIVILQEQIISKKQEIRAWKKARGIK